MFDEKSDRATVLDGIAIDAEPEIIETATMGLAEGVPATDRPLLRKPAPSFMSGQEMLDVIWRKSPWALDDDETDYGLEYEVTLNPKMWNFRSFAADVVRHGYLQANAKLKDGSFREIVSFACGDVALFAALMNGSPIEVEVRTVGGLSPHVGPAEMADCELWFKRREVDDLRVDEVMARLAEIEGEMRNDTSAVVMAAISSWAMPTAAPVPARSETVTKTVTVPERNPGGRPVKYMGLDEAVDRVARAMAPKPEDRTAEFRRFADQDEMVDAVEKEYEAQRKKLIDAKTKKPIKTKPSRQTIIDQCEKHTLYAQICSARCKPKNQ